MPKLWNAIVMAGLASVSFLALSQPPKVKMIPIKPTSPASGQQMYTNYCASCHGAGGIGNGPAAPALKSHPTNLTNLSSLNGGAFPAQHVQAVLKFGAGNPAHGSAEMPVWGDLLRTLHNGSDSSMLVNQRISNLTEYIKQIQQ